MRKDAKKSKPKLAVGQVWECRDGLKVKVTERLNKKNVWNGVSHPWMALAPLAGFAGSYTEAGGWFGRSKSGRDLIRLISPPKRKAKAKKPSKARGRK